MNLFLLRETLGMAGRALVANRLRSVLALLGIVIGVGTVIGMVALINGFQRSFQQSIQSFGNNTIYIRRIRPGVNFGGDVPDSLKQRRAFTMEDSRAILERAPSVRAIAPFKFPYADIKVTRDLIRAGQVLKIEVLDHVILGRRSKERSRDYVSLRELGHFA